MRPVKITTDPSNPTLKGAEYRQTHQHSVIAILGDKAPRVSSKGNQFYNIDRWTLRVFVKVMCDWAAQNKGCVPTALDIRAWVNTANQEPCPKREIVIANTPRVLPLRLASALTGGAYHEAFHTLRSCRRNLTVPEMTKMILPRWAKVPDWSKYYMLLQNWNNIIEDIRIEQCGCKEFPGVGDPLHDLQNFILEQEAQSRANSKSPMTAQSVITGTFRDMGLGYCTDLQSIALERYMSDNPEAVEFVIGKGKGNPGPLTGLLKKTIALTDKQDTACVSIALDVIGCLYAHSSEMDPANDPDDKENQPGESQKAVCPACQAPGSKLVIRPKSNGRGGKVKDVGILTCTVCGHQEEVSLKASKPQKSQGKPDPKFQPKFEGFEDEDKDATGGAGAGEDEKDGDKDSGGSKGEGSEGEGSEAGEEGEGEGKGSKGEEEGEGSDGDAGEAGDGSDGEAGELPKDSKGEAVEDGEPQDEGSNISENTSNTDADSADSSAPGGGHSYQEGPVKGNDWSDLADDTLDSAGQGTDLLDNNTALKDAIKDAVETEERREGGVKSGEARWNPYAPGIDEFLMVEESNRGKDYDRAQADRLYDSVKEQAAYLRARLSRIVRAMEQASVIHGVPKGRRLSPRFLVDTKAALMGRQPPKRAYCQVDEALDTSLAAAIVLDESGSMYGRLKSATQVMCAITEPLDALDCPVQVSGFRNGHGYEYPQGGARGRGGDYHRYNGITHDIFKTFDEPLRTVKWRFANTRADGSTPMADGVQYGLDALSQRREGHRILFIVTDGQPDHGHTPIIRRQIRLAKEAGIHVIGVGLGHDAKYVQDIFPDAVWTANIKDMPKALIAKLNDIIDIRAAKRGRKIKA